jgi:hypothetical protein
MARTVDVMQWTPDGTIRNALWIGGGQWAGKTTVAGLLTERHGLVTYLYDFHDARGHDDRRVAARLRRGEPAAGHDPETIWLRRTPAEMTAEILAGFPERFRWVLDDLTGILTPHPVLAEGWGLRPELVADVAGDLRRMVVLTPTDDWRRHQGAALPRVVWANARFSDPELAARNRIERDRLIAADACRQARRLGIPVIEVDGTRPAEAIADEVADHFAPFLP